MSRTFKDRPYWVKARSAGTSVERHDHSRLGDPIYGWTTVRDEAGEPVTEFVDRRYPFGKPWEPVSSDWEVRYVGEAEWVHVGMAGNAAGNVEEWRPTHRDPNRHKVEQVKKVWGVVGYRPDFCDIDAPEDRHFSWRQRYNSRNCWREVYFEGRGRYHCSCSYCSGARKDEGKASRTRVRDDLRSAVKNYRGADGDDWWGDELVGGCRNLTTLSYAQMC